MDLVTPALESLTSQLGWDVEKAIQKCGDWLDLCRHYFDGSEPSQRIMFNDVVRIHLDPRVGDPIYPGELGITEKQYKVETGHRWSFRLFYKTTPDGEIIIVDVRHHDAAYSSTKSGKTRR